MTALSPVQNAGICQDVLSFPVMEEALFLPCGGEGVGILWSSHARAGYLREWAAAALCSELGQQRVQVPGWSQADPHMCKASILQGCRGEGLHPQPLGSPRADVFVNIHFIIFAHSTGWFSLCSQSQHLIPKPRLALLLHSTLAILTSTHTDSHRIRRTTAFTM